MATSVSNNSSDYIASLQQSSNPSAFAPSQAMDQTDFLMLLTTQLQNQDPTKPMDPTSFVTDLTQMSQLEATSALNESVVAMTQGFQNLQTMQASSLIGKSVQAEGVEFSHTKDQNSNIKLDLGQALTDVTVIVSDDDGVVKEMLLGDMESGEEIISWDGVDDDGNSKASGVYNLVAYGTDADGELQSINTVVSTKVNSVSINSDGTMTLTLATGESVDMSAVREISE